MAELLSGVFGLEKREFLQLWLTEIFSGCETAGELRSALAVVPMEGVIDARGLFDAATAADLGKISDTSSFLYLLSFRESLSSGLLEKLHWVATSDMLADDLTKDMQGEEGSGLWRIVYEKGTWRPSPHPEHDCDYMTFSQGEVFKWRLT